MASALYCNCKCLCSSDIDTWKFSQKLNTIEVLKWLNNLKTKIISFSKQGPVLTMFLFDSQQWQSVLSGCRAAMSYVINHFVDQVWTANLSLHNTFQLLVEFRQVHTFNCSTKKYFLLHAAKNYTCILL